jgi:hypothetical protein
MIHSVCENLVAATRTTGRYNPARHWWFFGRATCWRKSWSGFGGSDSVRRFYTVELKRKTNPIIPSGIRRPLPSQQHARRIHVNNNRNHPVILVVVWARQLWRLTDTMVQFTSSAVFAILLTSIGSDAFTLRHHQPLRRSVAPALQMVGRSMEGTKYQRPSSFIHPRILNMGTCLEGVKPYLGWKWSDIPCYQKTLFFDLSHGNSLVGFFFSHSLRSLLLWPISNGLPR